jgi:hypothetical protein
MARRDVLRLSGASTPAVTKRTRARALGPKRANPFQPPRLGFLGMRAGREAQGGKGLGAERASWQLSAVIQLNAQ